MLIPSEHTPVSRSFAPFFAASGASADSEARRLVDAARTMLDGDDPDGAIEHAWYAVDGSARAALDLVAAGSLPLATIEVAAGLTGVARPKDYGVKGMWLLGRELMGLSRRREELGLLGEDALEMIASMEAACGPAAARELRERFVKAGREERALTQGSEASEARGEREVSAAVPDERVVVAHRIAALGAGGSSRADLAEARPLLWDGGELGAAGGSGEGGREGGLGAGLRAGGGGGGGGVRVGSVGSAGEVWEALGMAFDVVGAGSMASLDRLGALVEGCPGSPSLLWLDEIASRLVREPERAARRAEALDALLASGAFGKNAPSLAISVGVGRKRLREHEARAHEAWVQLSAMQCPELPGGPAVEGVPREMDKTLDEIAHALVLGFRELYGLELLRDALPRLESVLAAGPEDAG
ncbi:hypothetical protein [Chondromyces apiculatus]|uniref:Uncharacterized protein n=1 Tax=Chondromyces apiculatus DSM 436 TaxID=1192034 RepID=A0A017T786_9BACT|nr:hypothetical protein [Chondromyces apiculatus]EYF05108.1 Hypothetical protein CAP_3471 [Chondromyces apiculatus DSM 436]